MTHMVEFKLKVQRNIVAGIRNTHSQPKKTIKILYNRSKDESNFYVDDHSLITRTSDQQLEHKGMFQPP